MTEARAIANEKELDLVEASPNAKPPVVKLIDYGKFKYNNQKKANEAKKKAATSQLKEIQFRPNIEAHDLQTKLKKVDQFLADADKVKLVMQFRGREMAYKDAGLLKFKEIIDGICGVGAIVESEPKFMGRRIISIVAPSKKLLQKLKQEKQMKTKEEKKAKQEQQKEEETSIAN